MFKKQRTTTSIEHLNDELLFEILCRLPCYSTAIGFKTVSKRWCSLISDPLFATHGYLIHRAIKDENPSWALLLTTRLRDDHYTTSIITPPHMIRKLRSPTNFSLEFLPYSSKVVAMFRDLVLCFRVEPSTQVGVFYVCNPLTKQWMALPPSESHQEPIRGAALVYQGDGNFRVVVAHSVPNIQAPLNPPNEFREYRLFFYLSETRQWKDVDIIIQIRPSYEVRRFYRSSLSMFVCNGMVCLNQNLYFGAFNPFDVTSTFSGTLTAIRMPWPAVEGRLLECCGKMVAFHICTNNLRFDSNRNVAEHLIEWPTLRLDLNLESDEESLRWEQVSVLRGDITVNGAVSAPRNRDFKPIVVGVHPSKDHLVYLLIHQTNQLVLCDTKSQTLEPVTTIAPYDKFVALNKLQLPCWPTPVAPQNH